MNLYEKFTLAWKNKFPFNTQHTYFIVAVSGGVDSVVLCHLLHFINIPFSIAHCNFNLRNEESKQDELFVQHLAKQLNVPFYLNSFDTIKEAALSKLSIQVTARNLRYNWFAQLQQSMLQESRYNHVFLLTAHHANDNAETVLHHLIRGTGLNGLKGIDSIDLARKICRPLLNFTKQQIVEFANDNNINFVEDSSNATIKYTRNYLRNKVIPTIEEKFPNWQENMQQNIQRFSDAAFLYNKALQKELKGFTFYKNNVLHLPINKLKASLIQQTILWELLSPLGLQSSQLPEIIKLFDAKNAAYIVFNNMKIIKDRAWLIVNTVDNGAASPILIENFNRPILFNGGAISVDFLSHVDEKVLKNAKQTDVYIPTALIQYPLVLRPVKTADYFYPFGMKKKKKLSRFFIDLKLSLVQKEKVWVIESNKKIIWVVGLRLDDRFKVTNNNEPITKITLA